MEQKGETLIHELHMHTLAFDVQLTNPEFWPFVEPTYESLQRTFAFNFANLRVPSKNAKQQLIERVNSISSKTKVCFAEKEFCSSGYVARRGEVFHPKKVFFKIMCLAACHVNVTILYHLGAIKHMCTGFAADLDADHLPGSVGQFFSKNKFSFSSMFIVSFFFFPAQCAF